MVDSAVVGLHGVQNRARKILLEKAPEIRRILKGRSIKVFFTALYFIVKEHALLSMKRQTETVLAAIKLNKIKIFNVFVQAHQTIPLPVYTTRIKFPIFYFSNFFLVYLYSRIRCCY